MSALARGTSGLGNIALGYFDSDAIRTISQNGVTTTFTLDGVAAA